MFNRNRTNMLNVRRKNRKKVVKTVLQLLVLILLGGLIVQSLFTIQNYKEPDREQWSNRDGFVAVSYFGVGRKGTNELIAKERLNEQLKALYEFGYQTISQQDVLDFYNKGKPLPDKALYLAFEDGRNDSALFATPLLEDYNFKATLLSYANKMESKERKFLRPKELLKMEKDGFWELGSNGYRLSYLNIVDKDGQFLGVRNQNDFPEQKDAQYYTHYLMDFIRDANDVPVEDRAEMESRIAEDYSLMKSIYNDSLGYIPGTYMIMHANKLYNGMNPLVEQVNDEHIKSLFQMHFNRVGNAFNTAEDNRYNLSRVQPAPYWETNHLLMQLNHDAEQRIPFVVGDKEEAAFWSLKSGAAEYDGEKIALTSPPDGTGMMTLNDSDSWSNFGVDVTFSGHFSGYQSLYLKYSEEGNSFIRVLLREGELIVEQKAPGEQVERLSVLPLEEGKSGAQLRVELHNGKLDVAVDGTKVNSDIAVDERIGAGVIAFAAEADPKEVRWNEYDERDTIYDGVFEGISIHELTSDHVDGEELYSNRLEGFHRVVFEVQHAIDTVIDWAIETF